MQPRIAQEKPSGQQQTYARHEGDPAREKPPLVFDPPVGRCTDEKKDADGEDPAVDRVAGKERRRKGSRERSAGAHFPGVVLPFGSKGEHGAHRAQREGVAVFIHAQEQYLGQRSDSCREQQSRAPAAKETVGPFPHEDGEHRADQPLFIILPEKPARHGACEFCAPDGFFYDPKHGRSLPNRQYRTAQYSADYITASGSCH